MTLSLLAALAIGLAGYLSVAKQAMTYSNRAYLGPISKQLAEMGLEKALWSLSTNDWSSSTLNGTSFTWSINGTTATLTATYLSTKFGAIGTTASIKLRVDNYNAFYKDEVWSSSTSYSVGDVVGYSGVWYRCQVANSNKTPTSTSTYWAPDQSGLSFVWRTETDYIGGDMASEDGAWYRCLSDHTSSAGDLPLSGNGNWLSVPYVTQNPTYYSTNESLVSWYGTWYRYNSGWYYPSAGTLTWNWESSRSYTLGQVIGYDSGSYMTWYTCIQVPNVNKSPPSNPAYWEDTATAADNTGAMAAWNSSASYKLDDVAYRSSAWYRCILAHSNQQPPNSTYWSTNPKQILEWQVDKTYASNSIVQYNGVWYRNTNSTTNLPPAWPWRSAENDDRWNSSSYYTNGTYRSYGNVWYKCISSNSNKTPNNATYWEAQRAPVIYSEGSATVADAASVQTQLRAVVAKAPLFPNAAAASTLTFGSGATVDSYDSKVGVYNAGTATYSAILAGNNTGGTAVSINSSTVKGYLAAPSASSSPYAPLVSYGSSASLKNSDGTVTNAAPSAANVDLTRISRSPNIPLLDINSVYDVNQFSSIPATLGTPGAATPTFYNYYDGSSYQINLNTASEIITIEGPVILHADSNLRIQDNSAAQIIIKPTGSLLLIVDRDFRVDADGGGIDNQTLDPMKCIILLKRVGADTFNYSDTTQPFYGVIYLPDSSSTFNVGNNVEIMGAIYAQTLTFGTGVKLHYDTNLSTAAIPGVEPACIIVDWRELSDVTERASL